MERRAQVETKAVKGTFNVAVGRQRRRGIVTIEDAAEDIARRTKLAHVAEQTASYDRGYVGNRQRCPQCGQWQQYKGERTREVESDGGTVTMEREENTCPACGTMSNP